MRYLLALATLAIFVSSCKKIPGEGGNSSIRGKVWKEYRVIISNPATVQRVVPAADEEVYIQYGDNVSPDDRVWTNFDGEFEFRNLRPGEYTLYVYSEDTTGSQDVHPTRMPVVIATEISDRKQTVEVDDITIYEED